MKKYVVEEVDEIEEEESIVEALTSNKGREKYIYE